MLVLILALMAAPLSALATGRLIRVLIARTILDAPNARSSHDLPTPRGGGLAVMAVALPLIALGWILAGPGGWGPWMVLAGACALLVLSFLDDLRNLGAGARFLVQILCVALGLAALPEGTAVLGMGGWISPWVGLPIAFLGWVWFVNLFNFMDGIDGITGVETLSLGLGIGLVTVVGGLDPSWVVPAPILAGAALGFLYWNWHPAKVFLGDSGSIPLGYLLGALLIVLAARGYVVAALILPAYYLADATITLVRRALGGEKVWQAHRKHFYQRATRGGWSHARVSLWIAGTNLPLLGLALWSTSGAVVGPLLGTVAVLAVSLGGLAWIGKTAPP
ncbi:MAG: glycosyltransferase family 4 protein [Rhodospirillum sp.]|nr:glycosyltransferase family 4 protein [Rhodospirillum sp.]MCF8487644.1 glycosyltransferase family 4 protein [Rhodospirillum sp.]MCF8503088.1 glycosyltransferase family 4 protein [Rhodospirillum sp.]